MPDIVDPATRSRMMSGIRGRDTKPEMIVRRGLHARGLRFRLQATSVPGRPDLVFPGPRAAVFVHGCFWHHHHCHLFRLPATRRDFWAAKLARNRARDAEVRTQLLASGWRRLVIWECALKGRLKLDPDACFDMAADWIRGAEPEGEIAGLGIAPARPEPAADG